MVSLRCKMLVKEKLDLIGVRSNIVELGEVEIEDEIPAGKRQILHALLLSAGLELMEDPKAILIERIKNIVVEMVHYSDMVPKLKNSDFISQKLDYDYTYLANLFSETTGTTIEQYIISHKIERVKEYLLYNELNLTEISYKLNYSSVAHLSSQFKKVTGLTPSFFKKMREKRSVTLENV